ncbi:kap family p-loop domain protein [Leptolyngbya sp. Heron Island J]|uniref:P-loop NTPase fold protein n=1 Tax=Leptolyngbya sp. Heron Island J TaxID=1385935 RepID=UPI0003B9DB8A|nr:P-loop NTPase fold protein [Leptolyngbya sp. Heron Island J]ESA37760.1 kap family p-loop domain protein [Leptolyngbya sp. Heron Island J]
MSELKLLTDEPLGEGNDPDLDGLGFSTYCKVLGDAAIGTPGPFTIGVFGEWGTGKTSLMRLIQRYLDDQDDVITVWFNAWRYEREEHPIVPLVATIVRELERNKSFTAKLSDGGRSLIKSLRAVAYGFSAKSKVKVPGFAEVEASFVAKDMIDREEKLTPDPLLDRSLYYEAFERLSELPSRGRARIVVVIDDLDRCFPDLAIRLLESIKLVLAQPGFIFILGVARSVIEGYLQYRYREDYGIENFEGQSYLDKIVQLPFHIPPHTGRMTDFSEKILTRISPESKNSFQEILPIIGSAAGANPRSTVRFVNNLLIDLAINQNLAASGTMSEIALEYFAVSRCLQQRWPQVFSTLMIAEQLCRELAESDVEAIRREAKRDDPDRANVATSLLADRDLLKLLQSKQGREWLRNGEIRRATIQFLRTQRQESQEDIGRSLKRYDTFLSYVARDSRDIVTDLAERLTNEGLNVFIDTNIGLGERFQDVILSALQSSRTICACISPASQESPWQSAELDAVLQQSTADKTVRVIPILLPGTTFAELPPFLQDRNALDLREGLSDERIVQLVRALS